MEKNKISIMKQSLLPNGYNLDFTKVIDLFNDNNEVAKKGIIDFLKSMPKEKRALRFIGGNEGVGLGYQSKLIKWFISDICKPAEVSEIVLRVEVDDFETGIKYYQQIIKAGIRIDFVNFGNEEYAESKMQMSFWERIFINWGNNKSKVFTRNAANYANKFKSFIDYCNGKGFPEIKDKLTWCTDTRNVRHFRAWHTELRNQLLPIGCNIVDIHEYGDIEDKENYFRKLDDRLSSNDFIDLREVGGELHGAGFHRIEDKYGKEKGERIIKEKYYLKPISKEMHDRLFEITRKHGFEREILHCAWHFRGYFAPYGVLWIDRQTGEVTDQLSYLFE